MKRKSFIALVILLTVVLSGCTWLCRHDWSAATCLTPKTCTKCNLTEGEPLDHDWVEATCEKPITCTRCGDTIGEALEHSWTEATCTTPKTCTSCALNEGESLGHTWKDATYKAPKTCEICNATEGEPLQSTGKEINEELYKKLKGIWVDESEGAFLKFSNSKITAGWLKSEYAPGGTIKEIEKTDENQYTLKISTSSEKSLTTVKITISGKKLTWEVNNNKIKYVRYSTNDLDVAGDMYLKKIYG